MGLPGAGLPPRALEEKNGMKYTGSTPEKKSKGVSGTWSHCCASGGAGTPLPRRLLKRSKNMKGKNEMKNMYKIFVYLQSICRGRGFRPGYSHDTKFRFAGVLYAKTG